MQLLGSPRSSICYIVSHSLSYCNLVSMQNQRWSMHGSQADAELPHANEKSTESGEFYLLSIDESIWQVKHTPIDLAMPSLQGTCAFTTIGKRSFHSAQELATALQHLDSSSASPEVHDFDFIFPEEARDEEGVIALLYGAIGTQGFWQMHQLLAERAKKGSPEGESHLVEHCQGSLWMATDAADLPIHIPICLP